MNAYQAVQDAQNSLDEWVGIVSDDMRRISTKAVQDHPHTEVSEYMSEAVQDLDKYQSNVAANLSQTLDADKRRHINNRTLVDEITTDLQAHRAAGDKNYLSRWDSVIDTSNIPKAKYLIEQTTSPSAISKNEPFVLNQKNCTTGLVTAGVIVGVSTSIGLEMMTEDMDTLFPSLVAYAATTVATGAYLASKAKKAASRFNDAVKQVAAVQDFAKHYTNNDTNQSN